MKSHSVSEQLKVSKEMDRETPMDVARASICTKFHADLADVLTKATVDSILDFKMDSIKKKNKQTPR